ncbi:MAG: exo-beta-1,3-glucanase [Gammaproteobacteria bacterium]
MKQILFSLWLLLMLMVSQPSAAGKKTDTQKAVLPETLQCVAFSPYVGSLNPDYGPHPSKVQIEQLLDVLVESTPFRCIMTYGVLNGLDATFAAAEARGIKVIAILWLDKDVAVNSASISKGIEVARTYPQTIIKLSCGSEVRTRHGTALDGEITRCINAMREAKVTQPVTTIDTWWEWCNRASPCQQTVFASSVDWIGTNIFPWWENKHAGVFSCTPAEKAAEFHLSRLEEVRRAYPGKDVILTEFGWPFAPEGATEVNVRTGEHCGIANRGNQALVIRSTLKMLAEKHWSGVIFEAFSENWKLSSEGAFGGAWGICSSEPPYACLSDLLASPERGQKR